MKLMFATVAAVAPATTFANKEVTAEQKNDEDVALEEHEANKVAAALTVHGDVTPGLPENAEKLEEDEAANSPEEDEAAVTAAGAPAGVVVAAAAEPSVAATAVASAAPTAIAAVVNAPRAARASQEPAPAAAAALDAAEDRWLSWSTAKAQEAQDKERAECQRGQLEFTVSMPGNTLQTSDGSASAKTTKTCKSQGGGKRKDKAAPPQTPSSALRRPAGSDSA
jgi:hypothetical protein